VATAELLTARSTIPIPEQQRFVLDDVRWSEYVGMADSLGERPVRLNYDRGRLEFMTLSHGHERCSNLLGRVIETLTEELNLPVQSGGSTTFRREDVERGLEPDQCYYLTNEPLVRGKDDLDLAIDPPPDLAVEMEVSRSVVDRMGIYASFGVPELWRSDGSSLQVLQLHADGRYVVAERSRFFPMLDVAEVEKLLAKRMEMDETRLVRSFRAWVREQIARGWK
jgi:Uma2 family endonuclease